MKPDLVVSASFLIGLSVACQSSGSVAIDASGDASLSSDASTTADVRTSDSAASDRGDSGAQRTPIDTFLQSVARAHCEGVARCAPDELTIRQRIGSVAICTSYWVGALRNRGSDLVDSISTGKVTMQEAGASLCVTAVEQQACARGEEFGANFRWPAACRTVLVGTVTGTGICAGNEECQSGFCDCGRCAPIAASGQPCTSEDACAPDAHCRGNSGSRVCVGAATTGQSCTRESFSEDIHGTCEANLLCVAGTCHTKGEYRTRAVGLTCNTVTDRDTARDYCGANLSCEYLGAAGEPGVCQQLLQSGDACTGASRGICAVEAPCHGPSTSTTCRPRAREGEECFPSGSDQPCDVGLACIASRCVRLKQNGESCTDARDCYSGTCGSSGTCAFRSFCPER